MGNLLPGEELIYEHSDGVVYAHYRDKPEIDRWIIGGDPAGVSRAEGNLFSYGEWSHMMEIAKENPTLKKQLQKAVTTYIILKDNT